MGGKCEFAAGANLTNRNAESRHPYSLESEIFSAPPQVGSEPMVLKNSLWLCASRIQSLIALVADRCNICEHAASHIEAKPEHQDHAQAEITSGDGQHAYSTHRTRK
jgi:hypothetical protein